MKKKINNLNLIYQKKDIVVHGSNLGLTINKLRLSLLTRKIFNVPEDKMSIIIVNLLSYDCIRKQKTRGTNGNKKIFPRFIFSQSFSNFSYLFTVFLKLQHYCGSMPYLGIRYSIKGIKLFFFF